MGKVSTDDVRLLFEKFNCTLLSEYINAKSKLQFTCFCGENDFTTYDSFKNREHKMCKKCAKKISASKKRHSFEYVKSFFESVGCELRSTEYKNNLQKLDYICECGNPSKISFVSLQEGARCEICWRRKVSEKLTLGYDYVKSFFEEQNCELLEDVYVNAHEKMRYICDCGEISTISFANFQNGQRCNACGIKKVADKNRRSYKEVFNIFKENDCILLSTEYINTKQNLNYICSCGNESYIQLGNFLQGNRCGNCKLDKLRFSYDYVKNFFEENNCELITKEYIRTDQVLEYICECGRLSKTQFYRFKYGQRCMKCRDEKYNIGENSLKWNGGITSLANYVRGKMTEWKNNTENTCGYQCVITGDEIYDVHHIVGFSTLFKEALKIINLDIRPNISDYNKNELDLIVKETAKLHLNNGIGICISEDIHYEFHSKYGFSDNNYNQFEEFILIHYPNSIDRVKELLE